MRRIPLLIVMLGVLAAPAAAADKPRIAPVVPPIPPRPVDRIDSLIATQAAGHITIQAKGAVGSGGWHGAMLKQLKSGPADQHTIVVQFVATPPPPNRAVIMGLLPIGAKTTLRMRRGIVSVRAVSGSNEITTQILK
ncbi:MAG TPA: hypothetical protein VG501_08610 [Rhizomicrobium sp.]|nr:hypothetical protein [Rhizomicrobium sp.]